VSSAYDEFQKHGIEYFETLKRTTVKHGASMAVNASLTVLGTLTAQIIESVWKISPRDGDILFQRYVAELTSERKRVREDIDKQLREREQERGS
jgi:hypothetical protein